MALDNKKMVRSIKDVFGQQAAGMDTDPRFFNKLMMMPNPDPILRSMGVAEHIYASILADAHVMGDVRSIRGEFKDMDYRVVTWDEDNPQAQAARDLCELWMQSVGPNEAADWEEVMWQMLSAIFTGYTAHELVWDYWNGYIVPMQVLDRPLQRFVFDYEAKPLLITKNNLTGEAIDPHRFIISRHMAKVTNPYGQALLSSCFWPWTFKTGGWKYFVKYCERHGLPWPLGRYKEGASTKDVQDLESAIANMVDSGYAVVPDGSGVELIVPNSAGTLPQEALINMCNREMSKVLTGQAMVAELQDTGARAASETAAERQAGINDSDRGIAASSFSRIFRFITNFNFGIDVPSPELEFFKPTHAGKTRAETYKLAADMGAKPSRKAMLEELNMPMATDDEDTLLPGASMDTTQFSSGAGAVVFAGKIQEDKSVSKKPSVKKRNVTNGDGEVVDVVPVGIDAGWDHNVGESWLSPELSLGQKLATMPIELQATAVRQSINADYRQVLSQRWDSWYQSARKDGKPRGVAQIVGYLPDGVTTGLAKVAPELNLQSITVGVFDNKTVHLEGVHKTKSSQVWPSDWIARLPELMGDYRAVLWDTKNKTLVVIPMGSFNDTVPKISLRPNRDYQGEPVISVVSLGSARLENFKQGQYELVAGSLD